MRTLAPALLLAFAPAILAAQEFDDEKGGFKAYVSFGQAMAHSHAHDLTQTTWGGPGAFHAEFGVQFLHEQSTLLVRPNVGYTRILSKEPKTVVDADGRDQTQALYDVLGVFVGLDLVYNASKRLPLTITAGPSFHTWSVERANAALNTDPRQGERGMKLGFRMGLGYEFNSQYRLDMTYTMTEWRSSANLPRVPGWNPSLPAYFTVKGTYTF